MELMIHKKDDFDLDSNFLDIVSADMDFEQAYSMYSTIQHKQAVSSIENLQKVQSYNQQYISGVQHDMLAPQSPPTQQEFTFSFDPPAQQNAQFDNYSFRPEPEYTQPASQEFDQFFSNTESDALEKFLDNLANPAASAHPMDFYRNQPQQQVPSGDFNTMFNLHTMTPTTTHPSAIKLKQEEAEPLAQFEYPHSLPTPQDSRQASSTGGESPKRKLEHDDDEPKKRRRTSSKPLLSVEQKRLNHSHSEQKRRKLCKLAYERCLRLIIDIDKFNALPPKSADERPSKSKRARVNKDGLPNLSKHTALIRISNEITTIQGKNEQLKRLLAQYS
ncbi:hypothetical protein DICA3_F33056 [Diutina catenulata]